MLINNNSKAILINFETVVNIDQYYAVEQPVGFEFVIVSEEDLFEIVKNAFHIICNFKIANEYTLYEVFKAKYLRNEIDNFGQNVYRFSYQKKQLLNIDINNSAELNTFKLQRI